MQVASERGDTVTADAVAVEVGPFERQLARWHWKIAAAAKQGSGLDIFQAALNWVKHDVPTGNGPREQAKQELLETAERHLDDVHGAAYRSRRWAARRGAFL